MNTDHKVSKRMAERLFGHRRAKGIKPIEFEGASFAVPANAQAMNITHALCGIHDARGPMLVRWKREHISEQAALYDAITLYGRAITRLKFVPVVYPKHKDGEV
jgi:hypothetical protein